jgi:hypothetical protein
MPLILLGSARNSVTVAYFYLNGMMKPDSESKKKKKGRSFKNNISQQRGLERKSPPMTKLTMTTDQNE